MSTRYIVRFLSIDIKIYKVRAVNYSGAIMYFLAFHLLFLGQTPTTSILLSSEILSRSGKPALGVKSQIVLMAVAGGAVMVVISIICGIIFFCFKR